MPEIPTGTVTFLFTDIEGSTRRWEQHTAAMQAALQRHDDLLRSAIEARGGHVFKTVGDAFCAAFASADDALGAALASQRAVQVEDWSVFGPEFPPIRVRMGIHTGAAQERDGDYFGPPVNRAARLEAAGHDGQVLLSAVTWELVRDELPESVTLRDLGERRLKDLRRPERVFQVLSPDLPADFPPLATLDARPNNLPVQLTSFVGREREMVEVKRLLGASHLVTLTGIGGTGKTRLSLQVAADLIDDFDHGVWFVDLASLTDPALVASTVASVLGVMEEPGQPIEATLADNLKAKRLLIVLDNCEHLVEACATLAEAILRAAPGIRILATSREALAIAGESTLGIPPLSVPDPASTVAGGAGIMGAAAALTQFEAVRLFIDRAVAVKEDFAVTNANAPAVAGICHRLDGIPLAIELAAARVKMLTVEEIHLRLADRFRLLTGGSRTAASRQQTLAAAIDWSHDLLEAPEQALFRRLAVFRGGWTITAAEAVCGGDDVEAGDVLDLLGRLVDKSLAIADEVGGGTRYRFLETVREYARAKLEATGEREKVLRRHVEHFVAQAEAVNARFQGSNFGALAWFVTEQDNLRAVLERMGADPELQSLAVRLAIEMYEHWLWHGPYAEAFAWCERLIETVPGALVTAERAMLRHMCAEFSMPMGDGGERVRFFKAALADFLALGDDRRASWCFNSLGLFYMNRGEFDTARVYLAENLALKPHHTPDYDVAIGLSNLAEVDWYLGDFEAARTGWDEARRLLERSDPPHSMICDVRRGLGHLARQAGDQAAARDLYRRGLEVARTGQSPIFTMRSLICLAASAVDAGEPQRAALLLGATAACQERHALAFEPMDRDVFDEAVTAGRSALGDAAWQAACAEGRAMAIEDAVT